MKVRLIDAKDVDTIMKIHEKCHMQDFQAPDLLANLGSVLCEDEEGGIIGAGILKPQVEAIMILDLKRDMRTKHEAIGEMIKQAVMFGKKIGMDQIHAFVNNAEFAAILKKHHGFRDINRPSLLLDI